MDEATRRRQHPRRNPSGRTGPRAGGLLKHGPLLVIAGLLFGLLLLGLVSLRGSVLALAVPLALYLVVAVWFGPRQVRLSAGRALSASTTRGDTPVPVRLTLTNDGQGLEEMTIEDEVPGRLEVLGGEAQVLASLPAGGSLDLEYAVRGERGWYRFEDVQVRAADDFGILSRYVRLHAPGQIDVTPRVPRLRRATVRPRQTLAYSGPVPARLGGPGIDFLGVRGYEAGDPMRWINWRLSARHPRSLFTNEFEQERIADVGVILDARQRVAIETETSALFEHSVGATAALASAILRDGNRVGLLVYGRALDWTYPGYGKVQRERILRALARATTGGSPGFSRLDHLPARLFPARSQLVLVSPLCSDDVPPLLRLRARGYSLLVISPDPVTFEARALAPGRATELAARVARVERVLLLRQLARAGVRVIDWRVDRPLDEAVYASLGRAQRRFAAMERAP